MTDQPKIEHKWVGGELWLKHSEGWHKWSAVESAKDVEIPASVLLDHVARLYEEREGGISYDFAAALEYRLHELEMRVGLLDGNEASVKLGDDAPQANSVNEVAKTPGDAQEGAGSNPARSEDSEFVPFPLLYVGDKPKIQDGGDVWIAHLSEPVRNVSGGIGSNTQVPTPIDEHAVGHVRVPKGVDYLFCEVERGGEWVPTSFGLRFAEEVRKAGYKP